MTPLPTLPADSPLPTLPADFAWRQSTVTAYLRCPRRVYLEHVAQVQPDHALDGYASIAGSAIHEALARALRGLQLGEVFTGQTLSGILDEAFVAALEAAQAEGATTDPDRVQAALERLQGEQLELVVALVEDPRLRAIEWRGIEEEFELVDQHGRRFQGHIDAWGVARERVAFGAAARGEQAWINPGDVVLVDWKTGTETALDWMSRAVNVQLGFYSSVRLGGDARAFLGNLRDLRRPKLPKDERGESIPHYLEDVNPVWAAAAGVDPADRAAVEACRKRPKDAGPKWIKRENPAWLEATSRPAGPLFHECRLDYALIGQAIADAIDGARFGFWPASGAANGECPRCPFRSRCAHQDGQP